MKKLKVTFVYFISIGFIYMISCKSQQRVMYEFPAEMIAPVQVEYKKMCDKGKILYDANCAGCHSTKKNGKEIIPDFTPGQLESYQIRIGNEKHMKNITEESISSEELGYVMTFLTYKKKNKT